MKRNKFFHLDQKGFGLVEIIVTVAVITTMSIGFYSITVSSNSIVEQASDTNYINSVAQNKIEELRSTGFLGLSNGTVDFTDDLPETLSRPKSATYTISDEAVNLKRIELTISTNEPSELDEYTFVTYIGELGSGQ